MANWKKLLFDSSSSFRESSVQIYILSWVLWFRQIGVPQTRLSFDGKPWTQTEPKKTAKIYVIIKNAACVVFEKTTTCVPIGISIKVLIILIISSRHNRYTQQIGCRARTATFFSLAAAALILVTFWRRDRLLSNQLRRQWKKPHAHIRGR